MLYVALAGGGAILLGLAIAASPQYTAGACIVLALSLALLRSPALGILIVLAIAAILGRSGARILVEGVPILELMLVLAGLAAMARVLAGRSGHVRGPLLWLLPAAWGLVLLLVNNSGDAVSGLREALIFFYPLAFALPLASLDPGVMRNSLRGVAPLFLALAWAVLAIGLYNLATGHFTITSTGQLRTLATVHAVPLFLAVPVSLWLYQARRLTIPTTLLLAMPVGGLLLINSRSAYVAAIASGLVFGLMRFSPGVRPTTAATISGWRRLGSLLSVALCLGAVALFVTPEGRSGVARFSTVISHTDPNIRDRVARTDSALPANPESWLIGRGVGLVKTTLSSDGDSTTTADPHQTHNSFATALHLGGLVGFVLLAMPIAVVLRRSIAHRADPLVQVLVMLVTFVLTLATFNVVLENAYFGIWLWVPLAALNALLATPPGLDRPPHGH